MASLDAEIQVSQDALAAARAAQQTAKAELERTSELQNEVCSACKRPFDDAEHRRQHNEAARARREALVEQQKAGARDARNAQDSLELLRATRALAEPYETVLRLYSADVRSARDTVPPKLEWIGQAIPAADVASPQRELAALRSAVAAADVAAGAARAFESQIAALDSDIERLSQSDGDVDALEVLVEDGRFAYTLANDAFQDAYARQATAEAAARAMRDGMERAKAEERRQFNALGDAVKAVEDAQRELDDMQKNNALLKAVRAARPLIADKLWSIVLSAVSSYFSAMRGEQSSVTRSDNEFLVDGRSIKGLSGSTLDLLGASIRLALTRTFLPNSSFLALDEPAAAMDEERTQALLGFLVAAGFQQTVLVTHDEQSETVAQNLITL